MTVQELTISKLQERIKSGKLILVDFYADWCGPCKQMGPVLDDVESTAGQDAEVYKIDVDQEEARDFIQEQMVMSIPTLVFFKDGKRVDAFVGLQDKETLLKKIGQLK